MSDARDARQKEIFSATMAKFRMFDHNRDGTIDLIELRTLLRFLDDCWTDERIDWLFEAADVNKDSRIQFEEFLRWCFDGRGEHQPDFRESVGLDELVQSYVTVTVVSEDGSIIFGPEGLLGSSQVGNLRRRLQKEHVRKVGCLHRAGDILRDSMELGLYAAKEDLILTCVDDAFSILSDSCRSSLEELGALHDFLGQRCLRVGWRQDLSHAAEGEVRRGDADSEVLLMADGSLFAKYYSYTGYAKGSKSTREWNYEVAIGTFSILEKTECLIEVCWRQWATRQARDENADGPPESELLQTWQEKEVTEVSRPCHLFPTSDCQINMLRVATDCLKEAHDVRGKLVDDDHPLSGVPMPGLSCAVLISIGMDTDTEAYWAHGAKQGGPEAFSGRKRRRTSKESLATAGSRPL